MSQISTTATDCYQCSCYLTNRSHQALGQPDGGKEIDLEHLAPQLLERFRAVTAVGPLEEPAEHIGDRRGVGERLTVWFRTAAGLRPFHPAALPAHICSATASS